MAIDMGSSAPAPTAWKTRAATSVSRLPVSATSAEPSMNAAMQSAYSRRWPHTSERRPINGIATR